MKSTKQLNKRSISPLVPKVDHPLLRPLKFRKGKRNQHLIIHPILTKMPLNNFKLMGKPTRRSTAII